MTRLLRSFTIVYIVLRHGLDALINGSLTKSVLSHSEIPLLVLNVTYPLVDEEFQRFCAGKRGLLVVEEGQPEFIETQLGSFLYRAGSQVKLHGKGLFPMAGEYTGVVMLDAVEKFIRHAAPTMLPAAVRAPNTERPEIPDLSKTVPIRPPGFCTGCPERPIFAAMKLVQKETGKLQISADIGCHLFASLPGQRQEFHDPAVGPGHLSCGNDDGGKLMPMPRRSAMTYAQEPNAPLWVTNATCPAAGAAPRAKELEKVQNTPCAGFKAPKELGPIIRIPASRAIANKRSCATRPSAPASPNPELNTSNTLTPFLAQSRTASSTRGAGTMTTA